MSTTTTVLVGARGSGKTTWAESNGFLELPGFDSRAATVLRRVIGKGTPLSEIAISSEEEVDVNAESHVLSANVTDLLSKVVGAAQAAAWRVNVVRMSDI